MVPPPLVTFPYSLINELSDQFEDSNQRVYKRAAALRTMINRLIIRFSLKGVGTLLIALTLPVTAVPLSNVGCSF